MSSTSSSGVATTPVLLTELAAAPGVPAEAGFAVLISSVFPPVVFSCVPPTKALATVAAQFRKGKYK